MYNIILIVREIIVVVREIMVAPSVTALKLFTFCFYIGKNSYQELVRMLFVLVASLDQFHSDFFLVVYHNLGIVIDDPRVDCRRWGEVKDGGDGVSERLLLDAAGCDGNVWVEGSAVRNRWYKLNFNRVHAFKNLYDEYDGECFTWIDLDTIVLANLSYLAEMDNYFIFHGGRESGRMHDVLVSGGGDGDDGRVVWSVPEALYIHGSFWKRILCNKRRTRTQPHTRCTIYQRTTNKTYYPNNNNIIPISREIIIQGSKAYETGDGDNLAQLLHRSARQSRTPRFRNFALTLLHNHRRKT